MIFQNSDDNSFQSTSTIPWLYALAGFYVYFEANNFSPGYKAYLVSPVYWYDDTDVCFTFWYHMFGTTIGELKFTIIEASLGQETMQWALYGQQSPDQQTWQLGRFPAMLPTNVSLVSTSLYCYYYYYHYY